MSNQAQYGYTQGSILGPLLFTIFMNDTPDAIKQLLDLYTDDTILQASDPDLSVTEQTLNEDQRCLSKLLNENKLVLNTERQSV